MMGPAIKPCTKFADGKDLVNRNARIQNDLRKKGLFCDLTVKCEDLELYVHKVVLCGASEYFLDLLTSGMEESLAYSIEFPNISAAIFDKILTFIYLGEFEADSAEEVEEIARHSSYFQLTHLADLCESSLEQFISADTCLRYWRLAQSLFMEKLENLSYEYILNCSRELFKNSLFLADLTMSELKKILADNQTQSCTPEGLFELVLEWLKTKHSKGNNIFEHFTEFIPYIKFHLMSKEFLLTKVLSNKDLLKREEIREKVIESAIYKWEEECGMRSKVTCPSICHKSGRKMAFLALMGSKLLKVTDQGELQHYLTINLSKQLYSCNTFNNFLLISGGTINSLESDTCQYFSPITKEWKDFPTMITKRSQHASDYVSGKLYACGGKTSGKSVEVFDFNSEKWSLGANMNEERNQFGLCSTNNVLYAVGGFKSSGIERWDVRTPGWINILPEKDVTVGITRCIYKDDDIYCFGTARDYIFDTRMNKIRGKRDVRLRYQFDVCSLYDEFSIFSIEKSKNNINSKTLRFYKFTPKAKIILDTSKIIEMPWPDLALCSLYY